ncbi:MAG: 30S ribosomal protein S17 [bacterium]|nr:30S ribosomal protein S17 [bacterium]
MANNKRRLVGRVISDKMDKTVVVAIERRKTHPIYKKVVRLTKKIMAHDESNAIQVGALVRVVESRPLSRHKRWVVEAVLQDVGTPTVGPLKDEAVVTGGSPAAVEPADDSTAAAAAE